MPYFPFQKFIPKAAQKYSFGQEFKALQICNEYRRVAKGLLPENSEKETFPAYSHTILTIKVANSAWAQQLAIHKHTIAEEINNKCGPKTITNVRIMISQKSHNPLAQASLKKLVKQLIKH